MKTYRADLHIHTVLSPCGDLEMSPQNILETAQKQKLDILGITDHNSTRQCATLLKMAPHYNITVFCGVEITTKEEAHCLAFFEKEEEIKQFQAYLDQHLPDIKNNTEYFGYQVMVDENEVIIGEEERLLISALGQNINQIEAYVHSLNGIFIPAHIDRPKYSVISQLGFLPPDLNVDAVELSKHTTRQQFLATNSYLKKQVFIQDSDAHFPENIGDVFTQLKMKAPTIQEFKLALQGKDGREVLIS